MTEPRQRQTEYPDMERQALVEAPKWMIPLYFIWEIILTPVFEGWEVGAKQAGRWGLPVLTVCVILYFFLPLFMETIKR